MDGLIKCSIVPQEWFITPSTLSDVVINSCFNSVTCVLTSSSADCVHTRSENRALNGTWVIEEDRFAVGEGHWILEIYEVYEYQVTQYNPETSEAAHFVDYINTFLKLEAEASGYPVWVHSPEDEDR